MKFPLFIISLIILLFFQVSAQTEYKPITEFDPGRDPAKDLQNAIAEAEKTNKNIILDVGGEWCIWCHRIDDFIKGHEDINNFLHKNYVIMKVNYSPENKNKTFLSGFPKILGYPHFFVLNKEGELLHSQDTGKLEQGKDYNPEKFMTFLEVWAPKS